jgi:hypothetical protein
MTAILDGEGVCVTHHFESAPNKDYLRSCLFEDFNVMHYLHKKKSAKRKKITENMNKM